MSKTTTLYVSTIVVFVVGLWAVVRLGQGLRAPRDISGNWAVVQSSEATPAKTLAVAQSGRFVKLKVDGQKPVELILDSQTDAGMVFKGGEQEMTVSPTPAGPATDATHTFALRGPITAAWSAKREAPAVAKSAVPNH